jgi:hypothetical protein
LFRFFENENNIASDKLKNVGVQFEVIQTVNQMQPQFSQERYFRFRAFENSQETN